MILLTAAAVIVIVFIFAHGFITNMHLKKVCTRSTSGTVTEVIHKGRDDSAVITYKAFGKNYTAEVDKAAKKGEKIEICYNPENPSEIILKSKTEGSSLTSMMIFAVPIVLFLFLKKTPGGGQGGSSKNDEYKRKLDEIKADDDFDYGDDV